MNHLTAMGSGLGGVQAWGVAQVSASQILLVSQVRTHSHDITHRYIGKKEMYLYEYHLFKLVSSSQYALLQTVRVNAEIKYYFMCFKI